ncbi:prenyltransferase/squalene oxidase repeat-containing protein [Planctomycetota bacterium]
MRRNLTLVVILCLFILSGCERKSEDKKIGADSESGYKFEKRFGGKRDALRDGGGSPQTENTVLEALRWLKRHQNRNGAWDMDGFGEHCQRKLGKACDGKGTIKEGDPGTTGLAILAYIGAGYTHDDGSEFARTVKKGLKYLRKIQNEDGYFATETKSHYFMYGHAIATLAMTEAYGMTSNPLFREFAERGVDAILAAQNDHPDKPGTKYGWRYFPKDGDNDTSMTGVMTMALKSAKAVGLEVPRSAFEGAHAWINFVTDEVYYRAGYQTPGGASAVPAEAKNKFRATETTTAIAVLSRVFIGENPKKTAPIRAGAALLNQDRPVWNQEDGSIDYYYWYFGTLAMFQVGGDYWQEWNISIKSALKDHQLTSADGCQCGSWDPKVSKWGCRGGRVYATALNCLTMEVYYRYDKVFK